MKCNIKKVLKLLSIDILKDFTLVMSFLIFAILITKIAYFIIYYFKLPVIYISYFAIYSLIFSIIGYLSCLITIKIEDYINCLCHKSLE